MQGDIFDVNLSYKIIDLWWGVKSKGNSWSFENDIYTNYEIIPLLYIHSILLFD